MFNYNDVLKKPKNKRKINKQVSDDEIIAKYKKGEYRIVTEQARYPLANLKEIFVGKIDSNTLQEVDRYELNPEYQRRRVWDDKRKSRLIESFIINVPIPPIFLYEVDYSSYEIMDGLQRVSTIIDFLDDRFALTDLEVWSELEGKKYSELPREIRLSIDRRYLSSIILLKETANSHEEEEMMKKFVFRRLNTGGIELSPQEIRNAVYMSKFNEHIVKWAVSDQFRSLWGTLDEDDYKRMEDCELVLRFFAYKSATKHKVAMGSAKILDMYAEIARDFKDEDIKKLEDLLFKTLELVNYLFGNDPFKSDSNKNTSEKMIYDAVMIAVAEFYEENKTSYSKIITMEKGILRQKKYDCIASNNSVFNGKFTSIKNVSERVQLIKKMVEVQINEL